MRTETSATEPQDTRTIACHQPATGAPLPSVPMDDIASVHAKVARARIAQAAWGASSFAARRRVLGRLLDRILDDTDDLVARIVQDSGKTREHALMGEIWPVCEKLRWTIAEGEKHLAPESVSSGMLKHKRATIEYVPLGVVAAIIPWNYPLQNIMNPTIGALMAGNAVAVKPSEWVAWSAPHFVGIVQDALEAEGFSRELVQCIQGDGSVGKALIQGGVDCVLFIGSVPNGRRVLEAAAETITPVILELGGKDPFIVCDDADLEQAVHGALGGCFINCGQNCVASERILVNRSIAPAFEARIAELAAGLRQGVSRPGDVKDVGAMITPLQLELVERLVNRAVEQGARIVTGGHRVTHEEGDFFAPTVLADITPEMDIMNEEVFGPVMLLCAVDSDDEALRIANGTPFGLGASVFSRDLARARHIARELRSGMVAINDFGGLTYMAQDLPFGGIGDSGFGRMNGRDGLRAFTNPRAVLDDRVALHQPNKVFPVGDADYETFKAVVRTLYGRGAGAKARGVKALIAAKRGAR